MHQKISDVLLYVVLVVMCLTACTLFAFLPYKALDTAVAYLGF